MARTKQTAHGPDPAKATGLEKTEALKAEAEAEATAVKPTIKKAPRKALAKKKKKTARKAPAKEAPKAPTKNAPEVRGVGRAERSAEREKARRALEESFANAERRAEARRALGLDKGKGEATETDKARAEAEQFALDVAHGLVSRNNAKKPRHALESEKLAKEEEEALMSELYTVGEGDKTFIEALMCKGSEGDGAREVLTKLIMGPWDQILGRGVRNGTPEGSPPPGQKPVADPAEYYQAQEQAKGEGKGKEPVMQSRCASTEPEDGEEEEDETTCVRCGGTGADEQSKSSGEGGGQVRVGRVVGRKLEMREFRMRMRVVTQPQEKWLNRQWVGSVAGVWCGLDGELVCVQVDGEVYRNELASGVFENRVGRLVVPCRSTEGSGKNGVYSIETYWEAHELREVTGDTGIGSVLVTGG